MSDDEGDDPGPSDPETYRSFAEELDRGVQKTDSEMKSKTRSDASEPRDDHPDLPDMKPELNMPTPGGDSVRRATDEARYFPKSYSEELARAPESTSRAFNRASGRKR